MENKEGRGEDAESGGPHSEAPRPTHLAGGGTDQLGLTVHRASQDQAAILVGGDTGQRALMTLSP